MALQGPEGPGEAALQTGHCPCGGFRLVSNSQSPMTGAALSLACDRVAGRVHRSLASDRQCDCQALQAADNALWSTGLSGQGVPGATPSPCPKS